MLKKFIKDYPQMFYFLWFIPLESLYLLSNHLELGARIDIYCKLDDLLPFLPEFIFPYDIWYIYVPIFMIFTCFTDRKAFKKQSVFFFSGAIFCGIMFFVLPNKIHFRPSEIKVDSLASYLYSFLIKSDKPHSCCPSLHVYEALAIHLSTFRETKLKNNIPLRIISLITMTLIILATMFIKQHSFIDVIISIVITLIFYFAVYYISPHIKRRKQIINE